MTKYIKKLEDLFYLLLAAGCSLLSLYSFKQLFLADLIWWVKIGIGIQFGVTLVVCLIQFRHSLKKIVRSAESFFKAKPPIYTFTLFELLILLMLGDLCYRLFTRVLSLFETLVLSLFSSLIGGVFVGLLIVIVRFRNKWKTWEEFNHYKESKEVLKL